MTAKTNAHLAIDVGTHAVRACLFLPPSNIDQNNWVMGGVYSQDIQLNHLAPRFIEQDPLEIINSVQKVGTLALADVYNRLSINLPVSVGIAVQRSSVLAWDINSGESVSPILSWQDTRAVKTMERLTPEQNDLIRTRTGLVPSAHYGASKIQWLFNEIDLKYPHLKCDIVFGPLAAWLIKQLTNNNFCDPVNAGRTLLFNSAGSDWDNKLIKLFNLVHAQLPKTQPSHSFFGNILPDFFQGLPKEKSAKKAKLTTVLGDQNAAFVAMSFSNLPSEFTFSHPLVMNIGSGGFVLGQCAKDTNANKLGLLKSLAFSTKNKEFWLAEGTVNGAGTAISHWLDNYQPQLSEEELFNQLPQWLSNSKNEFLFLYSAGGIGSPFWFNNFCRRDSDFFTLNGKPCLPSIEEQAVAVINSIAILLAKNIRQFCQVSHNSPFDGIIATGGLSRIEGLLKRIAALSGLPIFITECYEATLQGIAMVSSEFNYKPRLIGRILADKKSSPVLQKHYERYIELINSQTL